MHAGTGRYLSTVPNCNSFSPNTIRYEFNFEANLAWSVFDSSRINAVSIPVLSRRQISEISECWACAHRHTSEMHGHNDLKGLRLQGLTGIESQSCTHRQPHRAHCRASANRECCGKVVKNSPYPLILALYSCQWHAFYCNADCCFCNKTSCLTSSTKPNRRDHSPKRLSSAWKVPQA